MTMLFFVNSDIHDLGFISGFGIDYFHLSVFTNIILIFSDN